VAAQAGRDFFLDRKPLGIRRLKLEAGLRRWRQFSTRFEEERCWVERWLHMIARSLAKQPSSAPAIVETATMIQGMATSSQGLADWHAIIDGLAKPTFDGALPLSDLSGAIAQRARRGHAGSAASRAQARHRQIRAPALATGAARRAE